jgi:ParB/RepB/Spo0J family partition protein
VSEIVQVPLSQIDPPLIPMREQFGDMPFQELCEDIGKNGIITPLKLRDLGERKRIVNGHRRSEAAKVCGLQTVPATVEQMTDADEVRLMISENTGREEVSDAEKGRHYLSLMEHFKLGVEQVAAMVNKSVQYVDDRVSFVQCDPDIADANRDGQISWIAAKELLRVNPYTAAYALRIPVTEITEEQRARFDQHRKVLLDLCIRCGATGKVARGYVEQWKTSLMPINPYQPSSTASGLAPAAVSQNPRCVVCGRDADPGNMVPIMVHHWERGSVFKILRAGGLEVQE